MLIVSKIYAKMKKNTRIENALVILVAMHENILNHASNQKVVIKIEISNSRKMKMKGNQKRKKIKVTMNLKFI